MQINVDFSEKLMGNQNHLRAFLSITKTTLREKSEKAPLQRLWYQPSIEFILFFINRIALFEKLLIDSSALFPLILFERRI